MDDPALHLHPRRRNTVIAGWDKGLIGMRVGRTARAHHPAEPRLQGPVAGTGHRGQRHARLRHRSPQGQLAGQRRVEVAAHIEALRHEGELMAVATESAGPDAPVPTCPEWRVRDLVRHTGGVHRWATGYVAEARKELWDVGLDDVVGTWPDDAALASWLRDGCVRLADALAAAPADLECWTFLRAPSPLAMWARRQAHETAVHRVDAELARRRPARCGGRGGEPIRCGLRRGRDRRAPHVLRAASLDRGCAPRRATALTVRCSDDDRCWTLLERTVRRPDGTADEDEAATESEIEPSWGPGPLKPARCEVGPPTSTWRCGTGVVRSPHGRGRPRRTRAVPRLRPRALVCTQTRAPRVARRSGRGCLHEAGTLRRAEEPVGDRPGRVEPDATRHSRFLPRTAVSGRRARSRQVSLTKIRCTTRTTARIRTCFSSHDLLGGSSFLRRFAVSSFLIALELSRRRAWRRRTRRDRSRPGRRGPHPARPA